MAVPKKRTSKRRKKMRRSHHAIKFNAAVTECSDCGAIKLSHHLCLTCGSYRGRQIIEVERDDVNEEDSAQDEA